MPKTTFQSMVDKLHPRNFPDMSPTMTGIMGFILDQKWTTPAIVEIVVTSDNFVLARTEGDCGCNDFIGSLKDLMRNWDNLLKCSNLNRHELGEAKDAFCRKINLFS